MIYLGLYLYPDEFDESTQQLVTSKFHFRRQKEIKARRQKTNAFVAWLDCIMAKLEHGGIPYTCDTIADLCRLSDCNAPLVSFWQDKIKQQRMLGKFGIANAQQYTLRSVIRFAGSVHIGMSYIPPPSPVCGKTRRLFVVERIVVQHDMLLYV